jgi:hypothetical protein
MLGEKIDGQMRAGAGCRRDADRNEQRERDLSEIVRLTGKTSNYVAQRPLQKEKDNQGQCEPLCGSDNGTNGSIEHT